MDKQTETTVWQEAPLPEQVHDLESRDGHRRIRAFLSVLYVPAANSAMGLFQRMGIRDKAEANELAQQAVERLTQALAKQPIEVRALPNYLKRIISTMMGERHQGSFQVTEDPAGLEKLERVDLLAEATSPNEPERYPWHIRVALEAVYSSGLSARDLDIFWTVKERMRDNRSEAYEELARKYGLRRERVRGVYCSARKRILARLEELLAASPRAQRLQFYKRLRLPPVPHPP